MMKKATGLILVGMALLMAKPVSAQTESAIGVKGGLNISNLYQSEVDDNNALFSFHGGLFFKLPVDDVFAFQPEVLFSRKGFKAEDDGFLNELSLGLSYIDVPLLAVVDLSDNVSIHAGPYMGFLINDPNGSFDTDLVDGNYEFAKEDFNQFDYGISTGINFNLTPMTLGIRYNYGLVGVGKEGFAGEYFEDSKNSVLQFYVAIGK